MSTAARSESQTKGNVMRRGLISTSVKFPKPPLHFLRYHLASLVHTIRTISSFTSRRISPAGHSFLQPFKQIVEAVVLDDKSPVEYVSTNGHQSKQRSLPLKSNYSFPPLLLFNHCAIGLTCVGHCSD